MGRQPERLPPFFVRLFLCAQKQQKGRNHAGFCLSAVISIRSAGKRLDIRSDFVRTTTFSAVLRGILLCLDCLKAEPDQFRSGLGTGLKTVLKTEILNCLKHFVIHRDHIPWTLGRHIVIAPFKCNYSTVIH